MISKKITTLIATLVLCVTFQVQADPVNTLQSEYIAAGAGPFSAASGEKMWTEKHLHAKSGKERSCSTCHTTNLKNKGKHAKTGKVIEPMAVSANAERLTKVKFINKWFKRNCKWTLGRVCTAQEKGDFLEYLKTQ